MRTSGVYQILDTVTGKAYVGSSADLRARANQHRSALRNNRHHSTKLQRAWRVRGEEAFNFSTLLICAVKDCEFYEQLAIDALRPWYNHRPTAARGTPTSQTRAKISASLLGQKHTDERRSNQSAAKAGKAQTPEAVAARQRGVEAMSPEAKKAWGIKVSETNTRVMGSLEKREAMSKKLKGRVLSEEHRAKLKAYALNRTPEHLAKLSAAATARYAKGKQNA